jgi:hypothetical protein
MERPNDQLVPGPSLCNPQLRKPPGFTFAAILTLAMAIGANAVVFGVMNGLSVRSSAH